MFRLKTRRRNKKLVEQCPATGDPGVDIRDLFQIDYVMVYSWSGRQPRPPRGTSFNPRCRRKKQQLAKKK
jgi:hypothetical protein